MFALALGVIFAAQLVAPQVSSIFDANTTGWDTGTAAIWPITGLVVVAAIIVLFLRPTGLI